MDDTGVSDESVLISRLVANLTAADGNREQLAELVSGLRDTMVISRAAVVSLLLAVDAALSTRPEDALAVLHVLCLVITETAEW